MTKREENYQPEMLEGAKSIGAGAATDQVHSYILMCYTNSYEKEFHIVLYVEKFFFLKS